MALPLPRCGKSCTDTRSAFPLGSHLRPLFLKAPTSSFFFVSTEITGSPARRKAFTCITGYQLRSLLGIQSRYELDGFLKEHRIEKYTCEDFEQDLASLE